MLTFRGGREVQGYPVSNDQAISEINESLGLGIDQFMAGKKIAMLNALATYLQARNEKLAGLSTKREVWMRWQIMPGPTLRSYL